MQKSDRDQECIQLFCNEHPLVPMNTCSLPNQGSRWPSADPGEGQRGGGGAAERWDGVFVRLKCDLDNTVFIKGSNYTH